MKKIQRLATLAGLSLALLALGTTGAKAQSLTAVKFNGSFTLNSNAQWGKMTLPAGQYNVYYGALGSVAVDLVEVVGKAKGSPHGFIMTREHNLTSAAQSSLTCIREGNKPVIHALQMSTIGKTVFFAMPHGVKHLAKQQSTSPNTQLAEAPMLYQQIPVTLNRK